MKTSLEYTSYICAGWQLDQEHGEVAVPGEQRDEEQGGNNNMTSCRGQFLKWIQIQKVNQHMKNITEFDYISIYLYFYIKGGEEHHRVRLHFYISIFLY